MWVSNLISSNILVKDYKVNNITHLVDKINEFSIFVCLLEESVKAVKIIEKAIKKGAKLVVSTFYNNDLVNCLIVEDIRCIYAKLSSRLYSFDSVKAKIIGVVGTNGKTSTVKMLGHLLKCSGKKVGLITTQKIYYSNQEYTINLTTPDPPELYEFIYNMDKENIEYIIMEVSAHAIFYKKIAPINFSYLIFTNISQDHLDFFTTYELYKNTKKSIFLGDNAKNIIINSDDDLGIEILQNKSSISYGLNNPADIFAINIKQEKNSISFVLNAFDDIKLVKLKSVGIFNVYNFMACIAVCLKEKISLDNLVYYAKDMCQIAGRIEYIGKKKGTIYLDYAHTPIGLKNVLLSLKSVTQNKLICLFGCGGNRDKGKREIMGKVSGELADFTIITTDNPRYEDPYEIAKEIEKGLKITNKNYIIIQDRSFAIKYAIDSLNIGDVLVVAGKGDEEYQEIMGEKHYFSDRKLINSIIDKC